MLTLKDQTSLLVWKRAITAYNSTGEFQLVCSLTPEQYEALSNGKVPQGLSPKLKPHTGESQNETKKLSCFQKLDISYNGWIPNALTSSPTKLTAIQKAHTRRDIFFGAPSERPILPSSALRLAKVIEKYKLHSIFIDSDINGLSLLLQPEHTVFQGSPNNPYSFWLQNEWAKADLSPAHQHQSDKDSPCDGAILHAGHTQQTLQALERACRATCDEALFFVLIRDPWDGAFARFLKKSQWHVETIHRDLLHWVIPGPTVRDGGGDLVVLRRPKKLHEWKNLFELDQAEQIRSHPYYGFDVDGLAPESLNDTTLSLFADRLAAIAPLPQADRYHQLEGPRQTLRWSDTKGHEVLLELNQSAGHLLATFLPYNEELEWATLVLIQQTLMNPTSRFRPSRSQWAGTEAVFS